MQVLIPNEGVPIKAWIDGVQLEDAARDQLMNLARMPFVYSHIAAMPDVHWGMGSTVGSVFATIGAIIPAAVGVDIGCGMMALRTSLTAEDLPDNLHGVRLALEKAIPHGRTNNGQRGDRGAWGEVPVMSADAFIYQPEGKQSLKTRLDQIVERNPKINKNGAGDYSPHHLGTLGTGNHFVEVCLDLEGRVWIMLHSGSRGIGNRIGSYFIQLAKEDMRKWFVNLPDQDLAYVPEGTDHFRQYTEAVRWAQDFARMNREMMMRAAIKALRESVPKPFDVDEHATNCHHNYVDWETHFGKKVMLTRKGAVSLADGRLGIVPGSMGEKSFIVRAKPGKPLADAFCSCSHGAGRSMSRAEANRRFTVEDHIRATEGVECRKDADVIDETPMAYKNIDAVMAAQSDHVEILHTLKQVVCVKG